MRRLAAERRENEMKLAVCECFALPFQERLGGGALRVQTGLGLCLATVVSRCRLLPLVKFVLMCY